MTAFALTHLRNSSVWSIYRIRERINLDPDYQREGEIWNLEKQQLLIDTIINGFDVPKIYFHKYINPPKDQRGFEYSVVDGKQRLQSMWRFVEGRFALDSEFDYVRDSNIKIGGLTYSELGNKFPDIKQDFDSCLLDIVAIETDDIELIEDLFSRLNEAMPLNAAEKRNAYPGRLTRSVRTLSKHPFFKSNVPFSNSRYRHFDTIAKMLYAQQRGDVVDTKKAYLDEFFRKNRNISAQAAAKLEKEVSAVLDQMSKVFIDRDPLLRQVGMVMIYYHLFRAASIQGLADNMTRNVLADFDALRANNRLIAAEDIAKADYDLLEFNRYTQWPNDSVAMRFRLGVMDIRLFNEKLGFA